MNTHYLASLFTPESVALFGASDRTDSVGGVVFKNMLSSGYKGRIYAINPNREEVQGQRAYPSLDEIEESIDLAVVATPAASIPAIVEACGERGLKLADLAPAPDSFTQTGTKTQQADRRCGGLPVAFAGTGTQ